jgi:putative holliday junction resolvase
MPVLDIAELPALLKPFQRLMGVDLGTKTIGLALSDVQRSIASPLETLVRGKFSKDVERLKALMHEHGIGALVIGLPLNMDGSEGPRVQATRAFARNCAPILACPIVFWDERLSTAAVTRMMIEADTSRIKRAAAVDKLAAAYILQGALNRLNLDQRPVD